MHSNTLDNAKATGNFDIEETVQRMHKNGIKAAVIYVLGVIFAQVIEYIVYKFLDDHKD